MFTKQQEELAERWKYFEYELEERDTDSTQRQSILKNELEKFKNEVEELRSQLRSVQSDCMAERRRIAEKENIILEHQLALRDLRDENRDFRVANDAKDIQIIELQRHTDDLELEVKQKNETLDELRNEKSILVTENASLLANINTLRANIMENKNIMEQNEEALESATEKISEIMNQLKDRDEKILLLQRTVTNYELTIDSVRERSNLEDELNRMSNATGAILHDVLEQYKVKERETSQILSNSQFEIARLNKITNKIKSEHNAELKRLHHEYKEIEKSSSLKKKSNITMIQYLPCKYLEESLAKAEEKMKELSLRCENITFENENLRTQLDKEKERCEKEMTSLRQQLDVIKDNYIEETAEWERIHAEKDSSHNLEMVEMKNSMKMLNDKLQQSQEAESNLRRNLVDLNLLIDREKDAAELSQLEISKKKVQSLSVVENELKQIDDRIASHMNEEAVLKSNLANNEREKNDLKIERDELKASLREAYIQAEEMRNNEDFLRKELGMMKSKLQDKENRTEKLSTDLKQLENENKRLEVELSVKTSDLSSLTVLFEESENTQKQMIKELEEEKQKNCETEKTIATLQAENEKLSRELTDTYGILEQKTATNQRAMDDLIGNYKVAEKHRIEAICQRENIVAELNNLKNGKKVAHFENSARRALSFAKARNLSSSRTYASEIDTEIISRGFSRSGEGSLRRSSSATLSPHVRFDLNSDVESISPESLDISSSVEITFRYLKDRIDELEQAKVDESTTVIRLKADKERILAENRTNLDKIRLLEQKLAEFEEDKRLLESRLSSSRQLLISQEESLRAKENERKALKSRVVSADLHARDKEARLSSLSVKEFQLMWDDERSFYESACKDADRKVEQYWTDMKSAISAKEKLEERLSETEHLLTRTRQQCGELEKANKEYRNMLERAKVDEDLGEDRRKQDDLVKITGSELLSKLNSLQHEYDNCLLRLRISDQGKQSLEIASMQRKLEELLAEKNRLQEHLNNIQKRERDNQQMEKDIHIELEKLRSEKITLLAENEELKRRLNRAEVEHREFDACRARLERERLALKRNIETLEADKQRTDATIRQITSERQALDKSLTTMEKENMELYRNCTQLQNQVVQLEKENGSHLVKESATQLRTLENKLLQTQRERQQIEQLLEQRELAYVQKIKVCESKIIALREQLDSERKRRLEIVERTAIVQQNPRELRSDFDDFVSSMHRLSLHLPHEYCQLAVETRIRAQSLSKNFTY
ncbi:BMA-DYF-14, isoform a [Dirofilaria immitis]|nr:BMA-DYF-14, isoform a [Dirofilaria immitis]